MKKKSEYEGLEDIWFFDDEPEYIEIDLIYIKVTYGLLKQNAHNLGYMNKEIREYKYLIQMIDSYTLNLIKTAENTDVINWGIVLDTFIKEYNKIKDSIKEAIGFLKYFLLSHLFICMRRPLQDIWCSLFESKHKNDIDRCHPMRDKVFILKENDVEVKVENYGFLTKKIEEVNKIEEVIRKFWWNTFWLNIIIFTLILSFY